MIFEQRHFDSLNSDFFQSTNNLCNLNFVHLNIRSLRKNFSNFLLELAQVSSKLHIIVLSEIWINSNEISFYNIPGYNKFVNCNDTYRSGGVICFVDNQIQVNQVNITPFLTADVILLNLDIKSVKFNLICMYRLQDFPEKLFIDELESLLQNVYGNTIYMADANINLLQSTATNVQRYHNLMCNNGFLSLVNDPTRITETTKSCIDHIFVRHKNMNNFKSAIFDVGITDHCILGLVYSIGNSSYSKIKNVISNEKKIIDYDLVKRKIREVNWDEIYAISDVNECFKKFHLILSSIVENSQKTLTISKLDRAKIRSPWITSGLLRKFDKRKRLFKILRRRPYDIRFKQYYNSFCAQLNMDIELSKNCYFSNKLENCNGDAKQQWQIINNLSGEIKSKTIDRVETLDGTIVTDPTAMADKINRYFISVQSTDNSSLNCSNMTALGPNTCIPNSFYISPTTQEEVLKIINSLKNKKSSGFDGFNSAFLKSVGDFIAPILCYLINQSFQTGVFPELLKSSVVVPILKKNNVYRIDNLRPISLLSGLSKIYEKVMKVRLISYLDKIEVLSKNQFGFIKNKSTEDALLNVSDRIYANLNDRNKVTGLFIDFKKAFDLVNHKILLQKLEDIGIRGVALRWFESYLVGRTQRVRVGEVLSPPLPIQTGVPQGAVLSANLFLIFINTLLKQSFIGRINAFADDIAIFYFNKNAKNIWNCINHDLGLLRSWCFQNKMKINVEKTKYINFDYNSFVFEKPLKFHNEMCSRQETCDCESIEQVNSLKYLGVVFDQTLSWEKQLTSLHGKIKSSIRKFYHLRNFCSVSLLRTLYFALVQSRLQYGINCWGAAYKYLINRLRITQNHFIRIILKKERRVSSFPLYKELNIYPVEHLFVFKVLKEFYVKSGNIASSDFSYSTRNRINNVLRLPKVNKSIFRRSNLYLGPKFYNELPPEIKNSNTLSVFCRKLKKWLFMQEDIFSLINILV
jgi:hypothetical protein